MVEQIKKHTTPALFGIAYAAFMGVSIPKVGAMFLLYSGERGLVWVAASYGAAITIDALIGFLTYATTSKRRDLLTQAGIWLFVLIFAAYSMYLNWIYDELHLPSASSVWLLPSPIPGWDVQQLTTLLISAIPLGILGFTLIARLIREEKHELSLEELRAKAMEIQERARLQQDIDQASVGRGVSWAKRRIQAGKEMFGELVSPGENDKQNDTLEPVSDELKTGEQPLQNETLEPGKTEVKDGEQEQQNEVLEPAITEFPEVVKAYPKTASWLTAGQRTATIEQIADATKINKRRIANRVNDGTLKRSPRNANLIVIRSVMDWLKTVQCDGQNEPITQALPTIKLVSSEQEKAS